MVLRPFSPARAWRPAVVARLARTLGVRLPRPHLLAHLLPPFVIAAIGLVLALRTEPLSFGSLAAHLLGAGLFYAAPHIMWAGFVSVVKPKAAFCHTGFLLCSASLVAVGALSFVGRDPSGLPYQWLVYWPLAGLLLLLVLLAWLLKGRPKTDA